MILKDKCAIVTGATKGIGKAIALKLAMAGANIVINYRSKLEEAESLQKEIDEIGSKSIIVCGDVSKDSDALNLINSAKEAFGKIDILVNNAGITKDNLILRMKEEDFDSVIDINLKGTFNCLKHVSPIMVKQRSGKIINISSVVGVTGNAGQVNYSASKAGIIGMTKSLAKELGGRNINVNAIAPGFINTNMTESLGDKVKEKLVSEIPLKKLGEPDNVADLAVFLASEESSYITGQVINVDGGMVI